MGIFETDGGISGEDLDSYFWNYAPQIPNGTLPEVASIDGGVAILPLNESDTEPALDLQVSYPIVWPQGIVVYQVGEFNKDLLRRDCRAMLKVCRRHSLRHL